MVVNPFLGLDDMVSKVCLLEKVLDAGEKSGEFFKVFTGVRKIVRQTL